MGAEAFVAAQIVDFAEATDDRVASLLVAGSGISIAYNDGAGTLTIASTVSASFASLSGSPSDNAALAAALDSKQPLDSDLTAIAALTTTAIGRALLTESVIQTGTGALVRTTSPTITNPTLSGVTTSGAINVTGAIQATALTSNTFGDAFLAIQNTNGDGAFYIKNNANNAYLHGFSGSGNNTRFANYVSGGSLLFWAGGADRLTIASTGLATFATSIAVTALIGLGVYTVGTLPSASANAGRIAQVTDSSVTANGLAVAGGGAFRVMVFSNGSVWDVVVA